jgi:hypothetical protein
MWADIKRLEKQKSESKRIDGGRVASLQNYKFALRQKGAATLVSQAGAQVFGVVYKLSDDEYAALGVSEGNSKIEIDVDVRVGKRIVHAKTWIWEDAQEKAVPRRYCMELIIQGALARRSFPKGYVDSVLRPFALRADRQ